MAKFKILTQEDDGSYVVYDKELEATNRSKAADAFYGDDGGDYHDKEILVINASQAESFRLARSVESVTPKKRRRRSQAEPTDIPQPPDPEDNESVSADAKAEDPFSSASENGSVPDDEQKEPGQNDDPEGSFKGFRKPEPEV